MNWNTLLTSLRYGSEEKPRNTANPELERTQFQRDYDRIVFSSPFRRLQNKTQVFPLPGSVFVHNRLTHSLEVACVGRSLGSMLAGKLRHMPEYKDNLYVGELGDIVAAACLAHDLGNPAFGHSGEKAISQYFISREKDLKASCELTDAQWADLVSFEGNANALRLLTHRFNNRPEGPFGLTYPTLATIVKYPCESLLGGDKQTIHRKKYGFFTSEKPTFERLATQLGILKTQDSPTAYARYPLSYLVEAADDICYNIVDIEDAHRLSIFTDRQVLDLLLPLCGNAAEQTKVGRRFELLTDSNDAVSLLRAKVIGTLIGMMFDAFWQNHDKIMRGELHVDLKSCLEDDYREQLKVVEQVSNNKIYNYRSVVEKEIAGYKVIEGLLEELIPAVLSEKPSDYHKKLLLLVPKQFTAIEPTAYAKIQSILDFVSGMTDLFAVELYKRIKGISFPEPS